MILEHNGKTPLTRIFSFENISTIVVAGLLYVCGIQLFFAPAQLFTTGFTGIAQLLERFFNLSFNVHISYGIIYFLMNIPAIIFAFAKIGRKFTLLTLFSVLLVTFLSLVIPEYQISKEPIVNAIFGGVFVGTGTGLCLRVGSSFGGVDFIAMYMTIVQERSFGKLSFIINALILLIMGIATDIETTLFTIVGLYSASYMMDYVHRSNEKITIFVVTEQIEEVRTMVSEVLHRGITMMPVRGAYSASPKEMMMIVLTKHELNFTVDAIHRVDEKAFINIVPTISIRGLFYDNYKKTLD